MSDQKPVSPDLDVASAHHENRLAGALSSSMTWNVANNIATNIVSMLIFVFLTYKLDAAVFGLFALGAVIVDYVNFQARSAFIDAIIQRRAFSQVELDTIFWLFAGLTGIVILLCTLGAGLIAGANDEPMLAYVIPVLALTLLPGAFSVPANAIMVRDHDFKGAAIRGIISAGAGAVAALAVVFSPFPEWTLVAQRGTQVLVFAIVCVARVPWRPSFRFDAGVARPFIKDAGRIFTAQALGASYFRALDVIVGLSFGAAAVGFVRIASRFLDLVYGTFMAPISALWVLLLSEGTHGKKDREMLYRRLSQMSALIAVPVFSGLALTSHDVVAATLSADYAPASNMLLILCLTAIVSPFTYFRNAALVAVKRLNLLMWYSAIDLLIIVVAATVLSQYSLIAAVSSLLIVEAVKLFLTVPVLLKDMHTRFVDLVLTVLPAYIGAAIMAGAVLLVSAQTEQYDPWIRLSLKAAAGASAYAGYLLIFHREWSMVALKMLRPGTRKEVVGEPAAATA